MDTVILVNSYHQWRGVVKQSTATHWLRMKNATVDGSDAYTPRQPYSLTTYNKYTCIVYSATTDYLHNYSCIRQRPSSSTWTCCLATTIYVIYGIISCYARGEMLHPQRKGQGHQDMEKTIANKDFKGTRELPGDGVSRRWEFSMYVISGVKPDARDDRGPRPTRGEKTVYRRRTMAGYYPLKRCKPTKNLENARWSFFHPLHRTEEPYKQWQPNTKLLSKAPVEC